MADNSELTFVRCPSCRSLIPAVSSRCRMCGTNLDGEGDGTSVTKKTSGRIRQKTMSSENNPEISQIKEQLRAEEEVKQSEAEQLLQDENDPLSAYIEEIEMDIPDEAELLEEMPEIEEGNKEFEFSEEDFSDEEEELEAELDITDEEKAFLNDDFGEMTEEQASSDWLSEIDQLSTEDDETERENLELSDEENQEAFIVEEGPSVDDSEDFTDELIPNEVEEVVEIEDLENLLDEQQPQENLELSRKESDQEILDDLDELDDVSIIEEVALDVVDEVLDEPESMEETIMATPKIQEEVSENLDVVEVEEEPVQVEEQVIEVEEEPVQVKKQVVEVVNEEEKPQTKGRKAASKKETKKVEKEAIEKKKVENKQGRLYGWLVSYDTEDGDSIELREGKFFVSRKNIKDADLILDNESISSPHALVMISATSGVRVCDLMSEDGIFVRRNGTSDFVKEEEVVMLGNGDWIRFGKMEFLIVSVPYIGEK